MKIKLIIISIILLLVIVFASGCIPIMEKLGLVSPTNEEQLTPEKGGPPDGLVKVLIGFKEKPGPPEQALVKGLGGKIKYTYNLIPAIAASVPEVAIEALKKNPNITDVELDSQVFALEDTQILPWGVDRIDAEVVHVSGNRGLGVTVAIIDTGIDNHVDLYVVDGKSFVNYTSDYSDDNGHGTHVAGIVAALDNGIGVVGVAPEAELYALKALDEEGVGYVSDVVLAIQWATVNEIQVINMSLGGRKNIFLEWACNLAYYDDGLLLVAAAGNGGAVIYPAAYSSVIAVSATDEYNNLASFSSTGKQVELAAPGVNINSTLPEDSYSGDDPLWSGTSMASPHVAGTAALVWAADTSLNNYEVREKLQTTAEDIGLSTREQGYGLVDADEAATESVDVHDVAVTAISVPSWVLQGDMVNVDVDVANEGTFEETFDVVLTKNPDGFSDTKKITLTLVVGDSTTVSFPWQTSELTTLGEHTLMATAGPVTGETDIADNSRSTIVTVKEAVANTMYVESIDFSVEKVGKKLTLYTKVKISLEDNTTAVEGATVSMTLTYKRRSWDFTGNTDPVGIVKFTLPNAKTGNYTATVTQVSHPDPDYVWDENAMIKSYILNKDDIQQ